MALFNNLLLLYFDPLFVSVRGFLGFVTISVVFSSTRTEKSVEDANKKIFFGIMKEDLLKKEPKPSHFHSFCNIKLETNKFYIKVYDAPEDENNLKKIESTYDYFNYLDMESEWWRFSIILFVIVLFLQFGSVFLVQSCLFKSHEDKVQTKFAFYICFLLFPAYNINNLCWTSKKVLYYCVDALFWGKRYNVEMIDTNTQERIRASVVVFFDVLLLLYVQIVSVDIVVSERTFKDSIINLFALTFILQLDEMLAQLAHVKVRLIYNCKEGETKKGMTQEDRRTAKKLTQVLVYLIFVSVSVAYYQSRFDHNIAEDYRCFDKHQNTK